MTGVEDILQRHKLKNTRLRKAVLSLLMRADKGLSHQDLSRKLDVEFDRVTLFRTLHAFEEHGILHKIMDPNGTAKYAYTPPESASDKHCHAHFICLGCEEVFCLEALFPLNEVRVPKGFSKKAIDVQVKGYCIKCTAA